MIISYDIRIMIVNSDKLATIIILIEISFSLLIYLIFNFSYPPHWNRTLIRCVVSSSLRIMLNVVTRRNSAGRGYINERRNDYHTQAR